MQRIDLSDVEAIKSSIFHLGGVSEFVLPNLNDHFVSLRRNLTTEVYSQKSLHSRRKTKRLRQHHQIHTEIIGPRFQAQVFYEYSFAEH